MRPLALAILFVALVGATPASARGPAEGDRAFDRAHWSLATGDTLGAIEHLRESPSSGAALLRLRLRDLHTDARGAWPDVLRFVHAGRIPVVTGNTSAALVLLAASAAIDRGEFDRAARWLDDLDVPRPLRTFHLHLRVQAQGDVATLERLARSDADHPVDRVLVDEAALRRASIAIERGEDAEPWLERVDPDGHAASWATLVRAVSAEPSLRAAALDAWLTAQSGHPAHDEALLHRAALDLDTGDDGAARDRYLELEGRLAARRADLERAAVDSIAFEAWTRSVWERDRASRLGVDGARIGSGADQLASALLAREKVPDVPGDWWRWDSRGQRPVRSDVTGDERARAGTLDAELAEARDDLAVAHHRAARVREDMERRDAYRARGGDALVAITDSLRAAGLDLDAALAAVPGLIDDLQALEDSLLARIETRSAVLARRASLHARTARDLETWYGRGPMARRDRPHPEVPVPHEHMTREAAFATSMQTLLDAFAPHTTQVVRRSFSEVFRRRIDAGTTWSTARHDALLARTDALADSVDVARARLDTHPELLRAESVVAAARAEVATRTRARGAHRAAVARRVLAAARATLADREEAALYGLAVATTRLALHEGVRSLRDEARDRWAAFVASDPDPRVRGDARYRWADLELVAARDDFRDRMSDWLEGGDERALAPLLDIDVALELFQDILREDPGFERRDLVLLHLGMLYADRREPEAETYLAQLVAEFPGSPVIAEAQLRRGEIAFERRDHEDALPPLRAAAASDDPEIRAIALYQLGWSAHATAHHAEAIDAFRDLLDMHDGDEADRSFDLADEARELLLRSMARAGGAPAFAATFDRKGEREDAPQILADLAELLRESALEDPALAADRMMLDRYPDDARALDAARRWVGAGLTRTTTDEAQVLAVIDRFAPAGSWTEHCPDDSLRIAGQDFARDVVVHLVRDRHERARTAETDRRAWTATRELYVRLIRDWPTHENAPRWDLLAGECAVALDAHADALAHFDRAAESSGDVGREAAWAAVATVDAWMRDAIDPSTGAAPDSLALRFLDRADAYRAREADDPRVPDLAWRALQVARAQADDADVAVRGADFATTFPDDERAVTGLGLRAEALYRGQDFAAASDAFGVAARAARTRGDTATADSLGAWAPHAFELHVEAVEADSTQADPDIAASRWRTLADRWPDYEHAARALYRSGLAFESAGRDSAAVATWVVLVDRHPQDRLVDDARRRSVRVLERQGDLQGAATLLLTIAHRDPAPDDAAELVLAAVDLRERAGDEAGRDALLDDYLQRFPEDEQTLLAVRDRRARAELSAGAPGAAVAAYVALAGQRPELVAPDLLAEIDFVRAEESVEDYRSIALDQPLEASIVRKRDALTGLIDAYRQVVERGRAPWAQAATLRIGEALLHMGDALLESERPDGLTGDDLLAYDEVLAEQAWTFHERGESALGELLANADDGEATAEWFARSRDLLYPRIARRFLHKPSFEFPVHDGVIARRDGESPAHESRDAASGLNEASDLQSAGR